MHVKIAGCKVVLYLCAHKLATDTTFLPTILPESFDFN